MIFGQVKNSESQALNAQVWTPGQEALSSWSLDISLNISSGLMVTPEGRQRDSSVIFQTEKWGSQESVLLLT